MPDGIVTKTYEDFSAGLNDTISPVKLADNEACVLDNASVNDLTVLEKARGYTKDHAAFPNDSDSFIRMLLNYKRGTSVDVLLAAALDDANTNASYKVDLKSTSLGTSDYIAHTAGTSASFTNGNTAVTGVGTSWLSHLKAGDKIKASSHADSAYGEIQTVNTDTSITLTSNYTGATAAGVAYKARIILHKDFIPRGIVFNNKAVITNGSERPMTYDNTTLNKITDSDCPSAKFVEAHKSRVFMASTTSNPSRIFWSAVNDETSWDATAIEDIYPQDNGTIIGIKSFADSLVVFKNNGKIYQVVGSFDQSAVGEPTFIRRVDTGDNIGVIAERTLVVHNDGNLYFVSETGLYKLNPRMGIEKVTYGLETLFGGANFTLGPTSSKAYTFDSKTQWDTGSHSGTKADTSGNLKPYMDKFTISDANMSPTYGVAACVIDSSNVVHVAYVDSADQTKLRYKQYAVDGTETSEIARNASGAISSVSIDVSSGGVIGIAYASSNNLWFIERTSGTWGSEETAFAPSPTIRYMSLRYNGTNPRIACDIIDGTGTNVRYSRRSGSTWATVDVANAISSTNSRIRLVLNGSGNPRILFTNNSNEARVYYSDSDGAAASWAQLENFSIAGYPSTEVSELAVNSSGQTCYLYRDSASSIKRRNATTSASSASIDTATNSFIQGYALLSDLDTWYNLAGTVGSITEKIGYEGSSSVSSTATQTIKTVLTGDRCMSNNGRVFAMLAVGANANELIVRRISPKGIWTGPEQSDGTLTVWGTYDVSDQTDASATILHEVATNSASPATVYATIVNGQQVSTNAANIYVIPRITFTLGDLTQPSIGSVILNYTGAGVDAKQMAAISIDDSVYIAYAETAQTANNKVLRMDREGAFSVVTWPVSAMERYHGVLYGGKSTNGDLLYLDNGYSHAGSSYSMEWRSKEDFLGSIEKVKNVHKIYILYAVKSAGAFVFSYRLDNFTNPAGTTWTDTTVVQTTSANTPGIYELQVGQNCRSIQYKITNGTVDNEVTILGIVVRYSPLTVH